MCVYIYMYVYINIHTHICISIYIYIYTHVCVFIYMSLYIHLLRCRIGWYTHDILRGRVRKEMMTNDIYYHLAECAMLWHVTSAADPFGTPTFFGRICAWTWFELPNSIFCSWKHVFLVEWQLHDDGHTMMCAIRMLLPIPKPAHNVIDLGREDGTWVGAQS